MLRLSKITDYGIVLLAHLAKDADDATHNARDLAAEADLPAPVVAKVLKSLAREGILEPQRGAKGGYSLARAPETITVTEMIAALEGPVALTECALEGQLCPHEAGCAVRDPWQVINRVVEEALSRVTLADLVDSNFSHLLSRHEGSGTVVQIRQPHARRESLE